MERNNPPGNVEVNFGNHNDLCPKYKFKGGPGLFEFLDSTSLHPYTITTDSTWFKDALESIWTNTDGTFNISSSVDRNIVMYNIGTDGLSLFDKTIKDMYATEKSS